MTRLPVTTTNDDSLRRSIGISGGLHFLGILFIYFGLPIFMKPLPAPYVPIPFEIVDIADITNTRIKEKEETPKPPEAPPKPEEQKPAVAFQPPQPPAPQTKPQPQPEQKPDQAEVLIPKPAEKPKPPEPVAKPQPDMLASVLKNVQKLKAAEKIQSPPDAKSQTKNQAQPKSMAPSLSERLTISEEDALRRQIEGCWYPPIGARDADKLAVDLTITVNPDRTVQNVEVVDKMRAGSDPYFRAASEAARRAVLNPQCSPLAVPEGKYEQWKTINFTFDPRGML